MVIGGADGGMYYNDAWYSVDAISWANPFKYPQVD
jgi:hypothetical protein